MRKLTTTFAPIKRTNLAAFFVTLGIAALILALANCAGCASLEETAGHAGLVGAGGAAGAFWGPLGAGVGLWESAEVRVNPTGSVEVLTGCHAHGQGHETTFAQVVAAKLGIPVENVEIVHGDKDLERFEWALRWPKLTDEERRLWASCRDVGPAPATEAVDHGGEAMRGAIIHGVLLAVMLVFGVSGSLLNVRFKVLLARPTITVSTQVILMGGDGGALAATQATPIAISASP